MTPYDETSSAPASVAELMEELPREVYADHPVHGETVHRTWTVATRRELEALQVRPGDRVLEIGTGSGYTGALLAELAGPHGSVTSIDIDAQLVERACRIHEERGVHTISCHAGDGLAGYLAAAPFDRIGCWCTPHRLPAALVEQLIDGGRMAVCLPTAQLPFLTVIAAITKHGRKPAVEAITAGGYVQSRQAPSDEVDTPHRWVDYTLTELNRAWVSIAWRDDDPDRSGAHATLDRLLDPGHTETYPHDVDWNSWNAFTATLGDRGLCTADLARKRGIGHSTPTSVAMLRADGTIIADTPASPSLTVLRSWLQRWEIAGWPPVERFTADLIRNDDHDGPGWDLHLSWQPSDR